MAVDAGPGEGPYVDSVQAFRTVERPLLPDQSILDEIVAATSVPPAP